MIHHSPLDVVDGQGNHRRYSLYLPDRSSPAGMPLLVYFHAVQSEEFKIKVPALKDYTGIPVEETGLIQLARLKRFALLVPAAQYEYTFLGCTARGWLVDRERDGLEKIIDRVIQHYQLDGQSVFLAGISAGAVMCHHLANHRPERYAAIISHSQGYVDDDGGLLTPLSIEDPYAILFVYSKNDYPDIIEICLESEKIYRSAGYPTRLIRDSLPANHRWSEPSNGIFWRFLLQHSNDRLRERQPKLLSPAYAD